MYDREEVIFRLRRSPNFYNTRYVVSNREPGIQWSQEDIERLFRDAMNNYQVLGTMKYSPTKEFFQELGRMYKGDITALCNADMTEEQWSVIDTAFFIENWKIESFLAEDRADIAANRVNKLREWRDEASGLWLSAFDGLYHANSVSTALSYIREKKMYSRAYGDVHYRVEQTAQSSDQVDMAFGIYNDIFFDNCDCRLVSNTQNVYGPITFVCDENIVLRKPSVRVRITKDNPAVDERGDWRELAYEDKYFCTMEDLKAYAENMNFPFRTSFSNHTTLWNCDYLSLEGGTLKYILIERHSDGVYHEHLKTLFEETLRSAGLENVPVIVRKEVVEAKFATAAPIEELWRIPD